MFDHSTLLLFVAASVVLLLTPGPAVFYIVARSMEQGPRAGLVSTLGIQAGSLVHVTAAALGLSALLVSSALAFAAVKYAGAAYLIFLGVRRFLDGDATPGLAQGHRGSMRRVFGEGVVVSVFNPKAAIFFLAFLPQFVDSTRGAVWQQVFALGGIFVALALVSDSLWALAAGSAGNWLRRSPRFLRAQRYFSGTVYVALGLATVFAGTHKSR